MNIQEQIEKIILPIAEKEFVEIVDIEYVRENGDNVLRIYIDADKGVNLDLCTKMSHLFGRELDKKDPIEGHYILEISSPGIDRKVKIAVAINNQKNFKGKLVSVKNNKIVVEDLTSGVVEIEISNITKAQVDS